MTQPLSLREIISRTIDSDPSYHGHTLMRSKLEVAFARHLDALGVSWEYEPAVFGPLGQGYLPDFLIRSPEGARCYVEVKPTPDQALAARERMEIIWATYPEAVLVTLSDAGNWWHAAVRGHDWTAWQESWQRR